MLAIILAAAMASGPADDVNAMMARVHAAKAAYGRCMFVRANELLRSSSGPQLEQAVLDACKGEMQAYVEAMVDVDPRPEIRDAVRKGARESMEAMNSTMAHLTVQAVILCAKRRPDERTPKNDALCATGGY